MEPEALNQITESKHVEPMGECWRTRVQFPPPPLNKSTNQAPTGAFFVSSPPQPHPGQGAFTPPPPRPRAGRASPCAAHSPAWRAPGGASKTCPLGGARLLDRLQLLLAVIAKRDLEQAVVSGATLDGLSGRQRS